MKKSLGLFFLLFIFTTVCYAQNYTLEISISSLTSNSIVEVNTSAGNNGVVQGTDGYVAAVNATDPGRLVIAGFDVGGTGPGNNLHFLDISWRGVAGGISNLELTPDSLTDSSTNTVGSPHAINGTIVVLDCIPGMSMTAVLSILSMLFLRHSILSDWISIVLYRFVRMSIVTGI